MAQVAIEVDLERCQGHGKCYLLAPSIFAPDESDDWGRPLVLLPEVDDQERALIEAATRAVLGCPENSITVVPIP